MEIMINALLVTAGVVTGLMGFWLCIVVLRNIVLKLNTWADERISKAEAQLRLDWISEKWSEIVSSAESLMEDPEIADIVSDLEWTPYVKDPSNKAQREQRSRRRELQKQLREKVSNELVREYLYGNEVRVLDRLRRTANSLNVSS